jgi:hypothetical protein
VARDEHTKGLVDLGRGSGEAHAVDGGEHRRGRAHAEADSDVRGLADLTWARWESYVGGRAAKLRRG